MQWKALVTLLLSCDTAATDTHTGAFTAVLRSLSSQLRFALAPREADAEGEAAGMLGAADEFTDLLQDSFLSRPLRAFLAVMADMRNDLPADLWEQVSTTLHRPSR